MLKIPLRDAPRFRLTPAAWALAALAGLLGCEGNAPEQVPPAPEPWYSRAEALDLTADGRSDTVRLEAHGSSIDSLRIRLALVVDGRERYAEEWGSGYEMALADSTGARDQWLRARLDSVLARVVVQRLDHPSVRSMAEDSAILAGIRPAPSHRVSISYGYETTVRLVWDAPRQRFVKLWSCC